MELAKPQEKYTYADYLTWAEGRWAIVNGATINLLAIILLCVLSPLQAQAEQPPKAWLTFTHSKAENGYNIIISGDRGYTVDNHFLITDPPRLVVDIDQAQIHKNVYLSVSQPEVSMVRAANRDNRVRVVLDLPEKSLQKYQLVARNNKVTINLFSHLPKRSRQEIPPNDGKVTVQLHKAELADFFAIISKASGHTIEVDESITTRISLRLVDINWEDALAQVLKLYQLDIEERGDRWYAFSVNN